MAAGCPWRLDMDATDVRMALVAAKRAKAGIWPVAGGWLDQTQKCLEAVEFIESEQAIWKADQQRNES